MQRPLYVFVAAVISMLPLTINAIIPKGLLAASTAATQASKSGPPKDALRSWPPDTTPYTRATTKEDFAPGGRLALMLTPTLFVRDVVVSNTDATLTNTDNQNDGEPSIAVNPANTNQIVITAFSGSSGGNAALWFSTDGGSTWTKEFTAPSAPGVAGFLGCLGGSPCDQSIDYGRSNQMSGTFLDSNVNIHTGTTTNPANSASWNWFLVGGITQRTNSTGVGNSDQPWLLVNRDTATASQDNVYVAYDDFNGSPDMRVAVALGTDPPNFVRDNQSGTSGGGFINPGHRLAVDPSNGSVYSLFQFRAAAGDDVSNNINYMLNRSTDGGQTWSLNGMGGGIVVANADSDQGFSTDATFDGGGSCLTNNAKFGTVNALFGGVVHGAVNPNNSDLYYVYGNRDAATNNNRLSIVRLTSDGMGGLLVGTPHFVTGQVQAALPSVAIASDGTVGVLYTQFDGMSGGGVPMFSAHLAMSTDQGATFSDFTLENFLSSATDSGACKQRVFGDFQEMKAVGTTFYGAFTANGVPFGRPFANHDPIFFKVQTNCTITCPANVVQSNDANQCGAIVNYPPPTAVSCGTVTCSPASGSFFPVGTTTVNCTTEQPQSCTFTVTVNDTQPPTITCPANQTAVTNQNVCPSPACQMVNYPAPLATDNCLGVGVVCNPPAGSCFPTGVTTVTCTATDTSGNTATCSFTVTTFDVALQDDSNPAIILLWNSITGQYRFCCNGTTFTGFGLATRQGCVYTLQHNPADRRVLGRHDKAVHAGSASLQSPPGQIRCTITDRNSLNDTNLTSCQ